MGLLRRMQVVNGPEVIEEENNDAELILKVGFATKDMVSVNQHFGSAQGLAIFSVGPNDSKFLEILQFGVLDQDGNESKLEEKIAALNGCAAVYCHAIGSSAVRQLLAQGIQPVKISESIAINTLIELLQDEMQSGPSTWLAKAIERQRGLNVERFDQMEVEGWDE